MGAIIDRLKDWWLGADQTQKLVTGFGLAFLAIILGFTVFFATKPQMLPVFVGLNDADKSAVYDELAKNGFKVDLQGAGGEVVVPAQDVARAKMVLASKNKLPKGAGGSLDIINQIAIGDSAVKEREKVLAAKEKELEDSIGTMDNIAAAQVHLNLGKDSPFAAEEALPSASVRITEDSDGSVTADQGKSIARLVEYAITNLRSSQISVVANSGRMIFDGKDEDNPSSIANNKLQAEEIESKRRQRELQSQLDKVFGPGNTIVDVAVTLNMDAIAIQENKTVGEDTPLVKQTTSETYTGKSNTVGGVAGIESNNANGVAAQSGNDGKSSYGNEATSTQYPSTNTKTSTQKAAGELTTMNILVMANSTKLDADALKALDGHVKQYIAPYSDKPGFTTSITPVAFNNDTTKIQEKAAADAASSQRMQQLISILPVGALLLVGAILMRSLTKTLKGQTVQTLVLANGQTVTIPSGATPELINMIETASATTHALETGGLEALSAQYEEEEVEEESGEFDEAGEPIIVKRKKRKRIIEDEDDDEDDVSVGSIKRRIDVPLEQIKKMSKKNPEAVAMLVKGWVMEERN